MGVRAWLDRLHGGRCAPRRVAAALALGLLAGSPARPAAAATRTAEVARGVRLAYLDEGHGRPLVFVPGWVATKEVFEHQVAHFSAAWRVIALDPRSQGASTQTAVGNDYDTHARDLARLLDRLGVERPVLVGWSFGCLETWGYVRLKGPRSVRAHVCIDLSPKPLSTDQDAWTEGSVEDVARSFRGFVREAGDTEAMASCLEGVTDDDAGDASVAATSRTTPPEVAAALFASGMFANRLREARAVAAARPTLHVIAEHWAGTAVPWVQTHLPGSQIAVLGTHTMFREQPDAFNALLDAFLAQLAPDAAGG